ncbi:putative NAD binding NADP oxidoreductase coenzyme F420-dependent [Macrophomina phaseolina]|uniref:NAD binding NADP oxidoreductase coenzyme F420-dependent n=1 Tax=Macrophomina phaseolina TaxID=35725 RepID=A0ABQ8FSB8_9PEZI|nr:putative NAD binding NADP oxidoreductase coenzyme F420-dependent [Macrophomina phaseolina]
MRVGFLGLGFMGVSSTLPSHRLEPQPRQVCLLAGAAATVGASPADVAARSEVIISMLYDTAAIRSTILADAEFLRAIAGKMLVNTSSVPAAFSIELADAVSKSGGNFIEMPVSGSRVPAERGELVGMLARDRNVVERVQGVFEAFTSKAVYCGQVGSALRMKYAAKLWNITMTAGLAEAVPLTRAQGLDTRAFAEVRNAGSMASPYSRVKVGKMLRMDWEGQALVRDCYNSTQLITAAGKEAGVELPLIEVCAEPYRQAKEAGMGEEDMGALAKLN